MSGLLYKDTKIIIGVIVVMVVVVGGIWYGFLSNPKGSNEETVATTTVSTSTSISLRKADTPSFSYPVKKNSTAPGFVAAFAPARIVGVTTISYLFGLKQPLVCHIKTVDSPLERSGTMYVANGEMRANFVSTSMLDDGTYLYVWKNDASTGLKLLAASAVSGSAIAINGGFDLATPLSFACNSWIENTNVFIPPASISFSNTP